MPFSFSTSRLVRVAAAVTVAVAALGAASPVLAQAFPNKPIKLILPFAAGGISDVIGRLVAAEMAKSLGQPVVADNRVGAGSAIGTDAVAKAAPDGYTIGFPGNAAMAIIPHMNTSTPYNPVKDLIPFASSYTVDTFMVVRADHPATSLQQLIAMAKAKPGTVSYGSNGPGSSAHLTGAQFESMAGIKLIHVPYKGEAPAMNDVMGGQLDVGIVSSGAAVAQSKAGKIRVLATASAARSPFLPDVGTVAEQGLPGYESPLWNIMVVPSGTPAPAVEALRNSVIATLKNKDVTDRMVSLGVSPVMTQPSIAAMQASIVSENDRWSKLIKALGLQQQ